MNRRRYCWLVAGWMLAASLCCAADKEPIREVSPGVLQVGAVRVEKAARALSFDAAVNMSEGIVEYALVTATGKTHESVFATEAKPKDIHVAALLLGIRDAGKSPNAPTNTPPALRGDRVRIEVSWETNGTKRAVPLEETVRHVETRQPLARGPWVYNGSTVWEGKFVADGEGSIVAIIDDRDALVNNPRPGRENDELWRVNETIVPPKGTRVRVAIRPEADAK